MTLKFWGASRTVTGSRYLLSLGGENVLVDCGLFQGLKQLRLLNREPLPIPASEIHAIVLTHAHLDHSGYIPVLVKEGFRGRVYATPATRELGRILLLDSGYLQEEEAKFANKKGYSKHHPALPLYTRAEAEAALPHFTDVPFGSPVRVSRHLTLEFSKAGHLLGAASAWIGADGGRSLVFSGDVGRSDDPIMPAPQAPSRSADYAVVESTYGDREHPQDDAATVLKAVINRTISRGGTVLIPSFAVGRAQLLLYHLYQLRKAGEIPDVPVYLNSPMANSANIVFRKFADDHRLGAELARSVCGFPQVVSTPEESKAINADNDPKIVIASSGMATGGRVLHHLKKIAPGAQNSIVFAGYQAAGTRGEALVHGAKEIKIHGEFWPVKADVINIESLSAHADATGIVEWLKALPARPKKVFITHGEESASKALADRIDREAGAVSYIPELYEEVEL